MIPLSSREFVEHTDKDGMVWRFKPKSGTLENELLKLWEKGIDIEEMGKRREAFIEKILISPIDEYKKADYYSDEKVKIIGFWNECNRLAVEEKKS